MSAQDDDEKKLFEKFAEQKGLIDQEPSYVAAFGPSVDELMKGRDQARPAANEGPRVQLSDEQRKSLGGGRYPALQGVVEMFARGLKEEQEISTDIGVKDELLTRLGGLDRAFGRLVWVGQILASGGETGELLTAAAAQGMASRVLGQANARALDPATQEDQRAALRTGFAEANRQDAERKASEQQAKDQKAHAGKPYEQQISQAQENADMARVIDAFLASYEKRNG